MLLQTFRGWWDQVWSGKFGMSRITRVGNNEQAPTDIVLAADGDADNPEGDYYECTRMNQFGDARVPPSNAFVVYLRKADDGICFSLGDKSYMPTGYTTGDRGLYSSLKGTEIKLCGADSSTPGAIQVKQATGASIAIDMDGGIQVVAAAGKDVTVNAGALKVARDTDAVKPTGTFNTVMQAIIGVVNGVTPGTVSPAQAAAVGVQIGAVDGGAARFKA